MQTKNTTYIQSDTTVIISVYNEEENIGSIIEEVLSQYPQIHICIIDDGSVDNTKEVLTQFAYDNRIHFIKNPENKGLNFSLIKGIRNIETKYFIVMDGDGQHPVKYIENFLQIFKEKHDTEIVIAERNNIGYKEFGYRAFISQIGIFLCCIKMRSFYVRDPLSGFFGGKTSFFQEKLKKTTVDFRGYKILFHILSTVITKTTKIEKFSYTFKNREKGSSKINLRVYLIFFISLFQ